MSTLTPHYVPAADVDMYKVTDPGWYAFDDNHTPQLGGPFPSQAECQKAIEEEARTQ